MAEQERNYLDIEATAAQVKKGIEEVVDALTTDILENNNKFFTLKVAEGLNEESTEEDLLNGVKIRLEKLAAQNVEYNNTISGLLAGNVQAAIDELNGTRQIRVDEYEIPVGNGNNWVYGTGASAMYVNSRLGGYKDADDTSAGRMFAIGPKVNNSTEDHHVIALTDAVGVTSSTESLSDYSIFQIGEKSKCSIRQGADVKFGRVSTNSADKIRLHIFDGAKIDIDGGINKGNTGSPQIYIHGNTQINIDDGQSSPSPYNGQTPAGHPGNSLGAVVRLHDKALLEMSMGSSIKTANTARAVFNAGTFTMQKNVGNILSNIAPFVYLNNNAGIIMGNSNSGDDSYNSPRLVMNGGLLLFNGGSYSSHFTNINYDPALVCGSTELLFRGQGAEVLTPDREALWTDLNSTNMFNSWSYLVPKNRDPRLKVSDECMIMIDGDYGSGSNWIKIGANNGGQNIININDNIYHEQSANSIFCMRGQMGNGRISSNIITRSREEDFKGDIQNAGAIFDMEGAPVFVMRSSSPIMSPNSSGMITDYSSKSINYIEGMETLEYMSNNLGSPFFGMETGAKILMQQGSFISMNNGAKLEMDQGGSISINGENITFKIGEDSETFTMNELHQLKSLLTNSTIS